MTRKVFYLLMLAIATSSFFSSCEKEENTPPTESEITINATAYDKWVYFSFKDTSIVQVGDFSTSSNWDIAFHRMEVRVNCGTAGPGQGGTIDIGMLSFSSVAEAPESGYSLNTTIKILESSAMPPVYVSVPGDTLMSNKWVTMVHGASGPVYTLNDHIYVIKTAESKYAKIWLKDYFNTEGKGGYPTMKYLYQPDGSRKFE